MNPSLLLVEDDPEDIQLTLMGFRLQDFQPEVVTARDGQEALDRLISDCERSRPLPAAILTDIKMPRMDGLELLRRIKDEPRLRSIPVIILTSSDLEADKKEALRIGAGQYLIKPCDLDDYAEIVRLIRVMIGVGASSVGG